MKKRVFALIVSLMLIGIMAAGCRQAEEVPAQAEIPEESPEPGTADVGEGLSDVISIDEELDMTDMDSASEDLGLLDW